MIRRALFSVAIVLHFPISAEPLHRSAPAGFTWTTGDQGQIEIAGTVKGSAAATAGLRRGDVLLKLNGYPVAVGQHMYPLVYSIKGGRRTTLVVRRNGETRTINFTPNAAPLEEFDGHVVKYGVLHSTQGHRLRTIVSRPARPGRMPAILFVQWMSCDSIDGPLADDDGWKRMIEGLVTRSEMVVWRTEKAGVGDSEGNCEELDWDSEVRDHQRAFDALAQLPYVDPNRIFIVGGSIGARLAPLIAAGRSPAGIVVWGGGAVSWLEYVTGHNRVFGLLDGTPVQQINGQILEQTGVLTRVLIDGASVKDLDPQEQMIWKNIPRVNKASGNLYNRGLDWHRQAARANWVQAWLASRAPVLITYGEFDRFDTLASVSWLHELLNERTPGRAELFIVPGLNHHFTRFSSQVDSDRNRNGTFAPEGFLDAALRWIGRKSGVQE